MLTSLSCIQEEMEGVWSGGERPFFKMTRKRQRVRWGKREKKDEEKEVEIDG